MEISDLIRNANKNLNIVKGKEEIAKEKYDSFIETLRKNAGYEEYNTGINKTIEDIYIRENNDSIELLMVDSNKSNLAYINLSSKKEVDKFIKNRHLLQNRDNYYGKICAYAVPSGAVGFGATYWAYLNWCHFGVDQPKDATSWAIGSVAWAFMIGSIIYRTARVKISENYYNKNYKNNLIKGADKVLSSDAFKPIGEIK